MKLGLSGYVNWQIIDVNGEVVNEGAQDNLILNSGLDLFGISSHGANTDTTRFGSFRTFLAVGTGSTAPDVNQSLLINEVGARSGSAGGFGSENSETYAMTSVTTTTGTFPFIVTSTINYLTGSFKQVRVVDFAGSYNLTEFGLSGSNSTNTTIGIRELFRDASGNPLVLSVVSGQQLKLTHTLKLSIPTVLTPKTFIVANLGSFTGQIGYFCNGASNYSALFDLLDVLYPQAITPITQVNTGAFTAPTGYGNGTMTVLPYVSGSYKKARRVFFSTSQANTTHYGYAYTANASASPVILPAGIKFILDSPQSIAKDSTKTLQLEFETSWGRA